MWGEGCGFAQSPPRTASCCVVEAFVRRLCHVVAHPSLRWLKPPSVFGRCLVVLVGPGSEGIQGATCARLLAAMHERRSRGACAVVGRCVAVCTTWCVRCTLRCVLWSLRCVVVIGRS